MNLICQNCSLSVCRLCRRTLVREKESQNCKIIKMITFRPRVFRKLTNRTSLNFWWKIKMYCSFCMKNFFQKSLVLINSHLPIATIVKYWTAILWHRVVLKELQRPLRISWWRVTILTLKPSRSEKTPSGASSIIQETFHLSIKVHRMKDPSLLNPLTYHQSSHLPIKSHQSSCSIKSHNPCVTPNEIA